MKPAALAAEAAAAIAQHRLRSFLSALGVIVAVAAVVAMLAVGEGARRVTLEQLGRLGARTLVARSVPLAEGPGGRERPDARPLVAEDAAALARALPTVELAAPVREVAAAVSGAPGGDTLAVLAVTADFAAAADLAVRDGRFIAAPDVAGRSLVCVLGAEAARALGATGRLGADLLVEDRLYRVVGVLDERRRGARPGALAARDYNRTVLLPLGAEPGAPGGVAGEPPGALAEVVLLVRQGAPLEATAAAVRAALARRRGGAEQVQLVVPREIVRQAQRTQGVFNLVLATIAGISLLVGGIGIMNIMLAGVAERTREIGLRRALGAAKRDIALQFLAEAALLTLAGGLLGAAAGVGGAAVVTSLAGWPAVATWWSLALGVGVAVAVGLLAGLYPAVRASRLDPIEALRRS